MAHQLCSLLLAVFGPNTCCNYYKALGPLDIRYICNTLLLHNFYHRFNLKPLIQYVFFLGYFASFLTYQALPKDCSNKFRSKHSTVLVLCLLRNLLEQSLSRFNNNKHSNAYKFSQCHTPSVNSSLAACSLSVFFIVYTVQSLRSKCMHMA